MSNCATPPCSTCCHAATPSANPSASRNWRWCAKPTSVAAWVCREADYPNGRLLVRYFDAASAVKADCSIPMPKGPAIGEACAKLASRRSRTSNQPAEALASAQQETRLAVDQQFLAFGIDLVHNDRTFRHGAEGLVADEDFTAADFHDLTGHAGFYMVPVKVATTEPSACSTDTSARFSCLLQAVRATNSRSAGMCFMMGAPWSVSPWIIPVPRTPVHCGARTMPRRLPRRRYWLRNRRLPSSGR